MQCSMQVCSSPNNKNILASFTHPNLIPNLFDCLSFCRTKNSYFYRYNKLKGSKSTLNPDDLLNEKKKKKNETFVRISSFVFHRIKSHTGFERDEGKKIMTKYYLFLGELFLLHICRLHCIVLLTQFLKLIFHLLLT